MTAIHAMGEAASIQVPIEISGAPSLAAPRMPQGLTATNRASTAAPRMRASSRYALAPVSRPTPSASSLASQIRTASTSILTRIRDNCQVAISFATRTLDGAMAALGEEIRQHADASPVQLNDPAYVGVVVWHDQAEHAAQSLSKGSRVVVVGRLQQQAWTAEDSSARSAVEVVAEELGPSLRWATRR